MKKLILLIFIYLNTFFIINAQQTYNHFALEHFKQSLEYMLAGDYANAIISSSNVLRHDPRSAVAYVIRARAYYELEDYDRVIADCTQAIRLDRNNAAAFHIRGNAHAQKGEFQKAISDWENALRIEPSITEAIINIETARQQQSN